MAGLKRLTIGLVAGLLFWGSITPALASSLTPFTATYQLTKFGIPLGKTVFKLQKADQDGCYVYTGRARLNIVLRAIFGSVRSRSHFCVVAGQIRPRHFSLQMGRIAKASYTLAFDWSQMQVYSRTGTGKKSRYDLKPGTQDPMSLHMAARLWLAKQSVGQDRPTKHEFLLAERDKLARNRVKIQTDGTHKLPAGHYDTVKMARSGSYKHGLDVWLAPYAGWHLVRFDRLKANGKTDYTMALTQLERAQDP